jgi:hypothetical protein
VKAIITEMLLKAIPKDIATEAAQKRYNSPIEVTLSVMIKYQPGSRKEKEALLQQISCPEVLVRRQSNVCFQDLGKEDRKSS